jgi:hypothetical protein
MARSGFASGGRPAAMLEGGDLVLRVAALEARLAELEGER